MTKLTDRINGIYDSHELEVSFPGDVHRRVRLKVTTTPVDNVVRLTESSPSDSSVRRGYSHTDPRHIRSLTHHSRRGSFSRASLNEYDEVLTIGGPIFESFQCEPSTQRQLCPVMADVLADIKDRFLEGARKAGVTPGNLEKMDFTIDRVLVELKNAHLLFPETGETKPVILVNRPVTYGIFGAEYPDTHGMSRPRAAASMAKAFVGGFSKVLTK